MFKHAWFQEIICREYFLKMLLEELLYQDEEVNQKEEDVMSMKKGTQLWWLSLWVDLARA